MYRRIRFRFSLFTVLGLLALFGGTLLIIYSTSYRQVLETNREMLRVYASAYWENGVPQNREPPGLPPDGLPAGGAPSASGLFCSVELDEALSPRAIHNPGGASDEELCSLAVSLAGESADDLLRGKWLCHREVRDGRTLFVFLDNTQVQSTYSALLRGTARFGALLLLLLVLLSVPASGWIIRPLKKAEREQRRFLSDAGHEMKTPCAVISANAELLERQVGPNRWLDNIKTENRLLTGLVRSLLDMNRAEEMPLQARTVDLSSLAEGVILPFEGIAYEKGHTLDARLERDVQVRGDEKQLSGLLSILLDNAAEHALPASPIRVALEKRGHHARLEIENGCAPLSKDQAAHLFDRFYQTDPARSSAGHYGMGLSIAQRIVRAHGGTIEAVCGEEQILFRVTLPLQRKKT